MEGYTIGAFRKDADVADAGAAVTTHMLKEFYVIEELQRALALFTRAPHGTPFSWGPGQRWF